MPKQILPFVFAALFAVPSFSAAPGVSADVIFGRRVYSAQARTYQQVWTLDTRTRHIAALTNSPRRHVQPTCSLDGKRIWFLSGAFGDDSNTELWWLDPRTHIEQVAAAFTGNIVRLLGGTGARAFFTAIESGKLSLYRWDGRLTAIGPIAPSLSDPVSLSPDAQSLAFQSADLGTKMMNANGVMGHSFPHCASPVWSPDMRKLACVAGHTIRVLDVTTGTEIAHAAFEERATPPQVADLSRDGGRLLVKTVGASQNSTAPQSDFWILDLAAKKWTFIGPGQSAIFAPRGGVLLVTPRSLGPVGKRQDWISQLLLIDPATHTQAPISAGESSNADPCTCSHP